MGKQNRLRKEPVLFQGQGPGGKGLGLSYSVVLNEVMWNNENYTNWQGNVMIPGSLRRRLPALSGDGSVPSSYGQPEERPE